MYEKINVYSPPYPRHKSYFDVIDFACEIGAKAVEPFCMFEFSSPDKEKALKVKEYADEKGIVFPCFSVFANVFEGDIKSQMERLRGFADVCEILGSPYLHHTLVGETRYPEKVVPRTGEFIDKGALFARELYDYSAEKGVIPVYEDQGFIFNGVKNFGEFLGKVQRDVGVVADFGNVYQSGDSIDDFIHAFHDKVVHAHIKDVKLVSEPDGSPALDGRFVQFVEIGKGDLDVKSLIDLLKSYGYDGYYGIEYAVTDDENPIIYEIFNKIDDWMK